MIFAVNIDLILCINDIFYQGRLIPVQRFEDVLGKELEERDMAVKTTDIPGANEHRTLAQYM